LRLLVASEEISDLLLLRRLLRATPYTIDTARSGSQAMAMLAENEYAAVVADEQRLVDVTGANLLHAVRRSRPHVLCILIAGEEQPQRPSEDPLLAVVHRPFFARPLVAALEGHAIALTQPILSREDEDDTMPSAD